MTELNLASPPDVAAPGTDAALGTDTAPGEGGSPTGADLGARISRLWSFEGRYRVLHLTWIAFFLTFVVWFNFAPFASTIQEQLGLTDGQRKTIGLVNVALTVPARVLVGMALDRWGPRRVYAGILLTAAVPNTAFALAQSFEALVVSRLALSVVGAGFVVGIRMVAEWFPPREVGTAEGVYGGWGNFGAAAAAFSLPWVAAMVGGDAGWRWAIGGTGLVAAAYGLYYLRAVTDTPDGAAFTRPRRQGALEVTSPAGVWGLAVLTVPINAVLVLIAWRVWNMGVIGDVAMAAVVVLVLALLVVQEVAVFRVNRPARARQYPEDDRYPFRSVVVLCVAYFAAFGSDLAIVTFLPTFFSQTWGLGPAAAGLAASLWAFTNLAARPLGGLLSDAFGSRRRTLALLLVGLVGGYASLTLVGSAWPWWAAATAFMVCSVFVQASEGAVFAVVPLVKKRVSGQVAGLVGAFGNVGAVVFLTAQLYVSDTMFFVLLAAGSVVALVSTAWLVEPRASFADEVAADELAADSAGATGAVAAAPARRVPAGSIDLAPVAGR